MSRQRYTPEQRRNMIINAAIKLIEQDGAGAVTMTTVAEACPVDTAPGTVRHYFPTVAVIMQHVAIEREDLKPQLKEFGYE